MEQKDCLRVGIVSDIHLGFLGHINARYYGLGQEGFGEQEKWWRYVLEYYKRRGVDLIIVAGDMANGCPYGDPNLTVLDCTTREIKRTGDIFREVFGQTDTQLFCIYGNHDNICQEQEMQNGGNKNIWQEAFGEPYSRTVVKYIKGFCFVGSHWGYEKESKDVLKIECEKNKGKPVFYIQHNPIENTTGDGYAGWGVDVGLENIKDYENLIAFFGHTHAPITNETNIWQSADEKKGKCTVISCGTLNYADTVGKGRLVRGENLMTKQGLYLTVSGEEINVERLSFFTPNILALAKGETTELNMECCTASCGKDWKFSVGGKKVFDFAARKSKACAPEFSMVAEMGVEQGDCFAIVSFPAAIPLKENDNMLLGYLVEVWDEVAQQCVDIREIASEHHIDHSSYYFSKYYQVFLPKLRPNTIYTFKVYATDCFYNKSKKPLVKKIKTLPDNT